MTNDELLRVIQKELFKVLREKQGTNFDSFISENATTVAGDITYNNSGVNDTIREKLWREVQIFINAAATTSFEERSRLFGWPNTYVFTKSMGEMILGELREDVPLLIIRPTIVTSTYAQPFPGWIEGTRTIDAFLAAYASGKLNCVLGDLNLIADVIPADMVMNAMLVMVVTHSNRPSNSIYHLGSSVRYSIRYSLLKKCIIRYFSHNPQMGKDGMPIKLGPVTVFKDAESFKRYMALCCKMPLLVLGLANAVSCHHFDDVYNKLNRQYRSVMRLVNVYGPYLYFKGWYVDNLQKGDEVLLLLQFFSVSTEEIAGPEDFWRESWAIMVQQSDLLEGASVSPVRQTSRLSTLFFP